jgi:hypothetical protein
MTPKFKLNDQVRLIQNQGFFDTYFIVQAIRWNDHVKHYQYFGAGGISAYEDEILKIN